MLTEEQIKKFDGLQAYVSCECDYEQAQFDFEDLVEKVDNNCYILKSSSYIFDGDDFYLQDIVDIPKLARESYSTLRDIFLVATGCEMTKEDYNSDFSGTFQDLLNQLRFTQESIEALQPYFKIPVECYETKGCGQGDYAFVLLFDDDVSDKKRNAEVHKSINHLFWDAPIFCRLVFGDGTDFVAEVEDRYEYDKDTYWKNFIEQLASEIPDVEAFGEYLLDLMPDEPSS